MPAMRKQIVPTFLGVDTGVNGGMALIDSYGDVIQYTRMPKGIYDTHNWLRKAKIFGVTYAVVERVTIMPRVNKTTAFEMGKGLSMIESLLTALAINYEMVLGKTWQQDLKLPSRASGDQKAYKAHKEKLRQIAQKRFPNVKVWQSTLEEQRAVCDAFLIADYCRRTNPVAVG